MNESTTTESAAESIPLPSKFRVGDIVGFVDPPGTPTAVIPLPNNASVLVSVVGEVADPEGIDVRVLWSTHPYFEVGVLCEGLEEKDVEFADFTASEAVLLPRPVPLADTEDRLFPGRTLAEMMSAEIQEALGESPTPESCEQAMAMTAAARDFLLAQRMNEPRWSTPMENFQKLEQVFGKGADDSDPSP